MLSVRGNFAPPIKKARGCNVPREREEPWG